MTEKITTESFEMNYFRFGNGSKVIAVIPGVSVTSVMGAEDQIAQSYAFFKDEFTVYVQELSIVKSRMVPPLPE